MDIKNNINTTEGHIPSNLWKLSWPIIITNLLQVLYNIADTFWVGKLENSSTAIGAITVSFTIIFVLISLAIGLTIGTTTLTAQFYGAKNYKKIEEVIYTSIIVIGSISLLFSAIGYIFAEKIFILLKTDTTILPYAIEYFRIILVGMIFMFIFFILSSIMRGLGNTKIPMIAGIISAVINMLLDPLLIFGLGPVPALGVSGAAYATLLSRILPSVYLAYIMFKGKLGFSLNIKNFNVSFDIVKKIFKIGLPASISQVLISLGGTVIIGRVNVFGEIATAAHGIGERINSLLTMPSMALGQAAGTAVGQNLGADLKDRAYKYAIFTIKSTFVFTLFLGIILAVFPTQVYRVFNNDPLVYNLGKAYIRGLTLFIPFVSCRIIMTNVFQGAGDAKLAMIMSFVSLWCFRLPMGYALSFTSMGIKGLWLGIGLSFIVSFFVMYWFFQRKKWLNKALV